MVIKQYYLACLAHASYFVADEKSKVAAVRSDKKWAAGHISGSTPDCRCSGVL